VTKINEAMFLRPHFVITFMMTVHETSRKYVNILAVSKTVKEHF